MLPAAFLDPAQAGQALLPVLSVPPVPSRRSVPDAMSPVSVLAKEESQNLWRLLVRLRRRNPARACSAWAWVNVSAWSGECHEAGRASPGGPLGAPPGASATGGVAPPRLARPAATQLPDAVLAAGTAEGAGIRQRLAPAAEPGTLALPRSCPGAVGTPPATTPPGPRPVPPARPRPRPARPGPRSAVEPSPEPHGEPP